MAGIEQLNQNKTTQRQKLKKSVEDDEKNQKSIFDLDLTKNFDSLPKEIKEQLKLLNTSAVESKKYYMEKKQ